MNFSFYAICIFLLFRIHDVTCLKNVKIRAKKAVRAGDVLNLECDYDLENALLYSIKWYLGDNEFYRYVPKESPPTRVFPLSGIIVDLSQSNDRKVALSNMQRGLTGYYKCEVSADAPSFHTDIKAAHVIIIEQPKSPPLLWTEKTKYAAGEPITANCTVLKAYPAPNITWFINAQKINSTLSVNISNAESKDADGFQSIRSQLEILPGTSKYFKTGRMSVSCEATQYDLYSANSTVEIHDDTPQLAHVLSPSSTFGHDHSDQLNANNILFFINLLLTSMLTLRR